MTTIFWPFGLRQGVMVKWPCPKFQNDHGQMVKNMTMTVHVDYQWPWSNFLIPLHGENSGGQWPRSIIFRPLTLGKIPGTKISGHFQVFNHRENSRVSWTWIWWNIFDHWKRAKFLGICCQGRVFLTIGYEEIQKNRGHGHVIWPLTMGKIPDGQWSWSIFWSLTMGQIPGCHGQCLTPPTHWVHTRIYLVILARITYDMRYLTQSFDLCASPG